MTGATPGMILLAIFVAILVFMLVVWLVQITYNWSIVPMTGYTAPHMSYWTAIVFVFFIALTGAIFTRPGEKQAINYYAM